MPQSSPPSWLTLIVAPVTAGLLLYAAGQLAIVTTEVNKTIVNVEHLTRTLEDHEVRIRVLEKG